MLAIASASGLVDFMRKLAGYRAKKYGSELGNSYVRPLCARVSELLQPARPVL
jgi:hypothetical protein